MAPESYIIVWRTDLARWFIVQRDGPSRLVDTAGQPRNVRLQADADLRASYSRNNHYRVVGACELPSYGIMMPGTPKRSPCPECGTNILRTNLYIPRHMVQVLHPDPAYLMKRVVSVECIAGVRRS